MCPFFSLVMGGVLGAEMLVARRAERSGGHGDVNTNSAHHIFIHFTWLQRARPGRGGHGGQRGAEGQGAGAIRRKDKGRAAHGTRGLCLAERVDARLAEGVAAGKVARGGERFLTHGAALVDVEGENNLHSALDMSLFLYIRRI
jgi:hypothetical protein